MVIRKNPKLRSKKLELFKLIIKKHPVDIYFFWRIGIKDIEKGKINNSFTDWVGDNIKKQVIMNLTKIRYRNKISSKHLKV